MLGTAPKAARKPGLPWLWRRLARSCRSRPHDFTPVGRRTWVSEPIASIITDTINTSHGPGPSHERLTRLHPG